MCFRLSVSGSINQVDTHTNTSCCSRPIIVGRNSCCEKSGQIRSMTTTRWYLGEVRLRCFSFRNGFTRKGGCVISVGRIGQCVYKQQLQNLAKLPAWEFTFDWIDWLQRVCRLTETALVGASHGIRFISLPNISLELVDHQQSER